MKIATLTFHWSENYGAVLQAYALQRHLQLEGYETEIINYIPLRVRFIQICLKLKSKNINEFVKLNKFNKFRKKNLVLSKSIFYTNRMLHKKCINYDSYICGSDQIWNESFLLTAEGKRKSTLSYYLDFVPEDKKRIAYAVSFGTEKLRTEIKLLVEPEIKKFQAISVREETGQKIMQEFSINAPLVVDPTLLLDKKEYDRIIEFPDNKNKYALFAYILHDKQKLAHQIKIYIYNQYFKNQGEKYYDSEPIGIGEWLYNIKNTRFVLTNSFHGVVFSLIFNTPFIAIPVENSKMNDRIYTLLKTVNLTDRIVENFDKKQINKLIQKSDINWIYVNKTIQKDRNKSIEYLKNSLGPKSSNRDETYLEN